jgi:hypothetical protein
LDYDRLIRRIRNSDILFDSTETHKVHRILEKALHMSAKRRGEPNPSVGPYSGLTHRELAQSGTCETDWF